MPMLIDDPSGRAEQSPTIFIQLEVANADDKWLPTASSKIPNERFLFFSEFIMPLDEKCVYFFSKICDRTTLRILS